MKGIFWKTISVVIISVFLLTSVAYMENPSVDDLFYLDMESTEELNDVDSIFETNNTQLTESNLQENCCFDNESLLSEAIDDPVEEGLEIDLPIEQYDMEGIEIDNTEDSSTVVTEDLLLYDSDQSDVTLEASSSKDYSLMESRITPEFYFTDTEAVFYQNSLYALFHGCSDAKYREDVGYLDYQFGRRLNNSGKIDEGLVGEAAVFWLRNYDFSARGLIESFIHHDWYNQDSTEINTILSSNPTITLVYSELYSWGKTEYGVFEDDEYYRFGITIPRSYGYELYDIAFCIGDTYEGGEWCSYKVLNHEYINKPDSTGNDTQNTSPSTSSSSIPIILVLKSNVKSKVNVGNNYQINLNGKTGIKYKSSKKKVATVNYSGLITAKSAGKTKITFKVGKKRRVLTLTVVDPTIPNKISLNMAGTNTVNQGDTVSLSAILPEGTHSGIKWESNHKSIATVSNGIVRFKKKGTVTITATTTRGKKKAKVKFIVTKYDTKKDLANYGWRTVTGVTGDNKLTFRKTHKGGYMSNHRFANGEQIFVNLTWREGGDAIAYDNGTYGYVQSKYIAW